MIVVDASVAVKWFAPEPGSAEAEALLVGDESRAAPEHLTVEVAEALLRHYRNRGVTLDHCREAPVFAGTSDCSQPRRSLPKR